MSKQYAGTRISLWNETIHICRATGMALGAVAVLLLFVGPLLVIFGFVAAESHGWQVVLSIVGVVAVLPVAGFFVFLLISERYIDKVLAIWRLRPDERIDSLIDALKAVQSFIVPREFTDAATSRMMHDYSYERNSPSLVEEQLIVPHGCRRWWALRRLSWIGTAAVPTLIHELVNQNGDDDFQDRIERLLIRHAKSDLTIREQVQVATHAVHQNDIPDRLSAFMRRLGMATRNTS